jgi:hypothetical protein
VEEKQSRCRSAGQGAGEARIVAGEFVARWCQAAALEFDACRRGVLQIMLLDPVLLVGFLLRPKHASAPVRDRHVRIRCPLCEWQPAKSDTWSCNPDGCGQIWNTFETGGVCPSCQRQWERTACLRCGRWSLHDLWYESD